MVQVGDYLVPTVGNYMAGISYLVTCPGPEGPSWGLSGPHCWELYDWYIIPCDLSRA